MFGNMLDPDQRLAMVREDLAGVKHLHRRSPAIPAPDQPITLNLTTSGPLPFDAARCWFTIERDRQRQTADGGQRSAVGDPTVLDLHPDGSVWDTVEWGYFRRWIGSLPPQPAGTIIRYRLAARITGGTPAGSNDFSRSASGSNDLSRASDSGRWVFADNQAISAEGATSFAIWIDRDTVPAWAREAIVYHIFLDRFYPGEGKEWLQPASLSGFFGGTIRGVIQKLDYIQSFGFNALWLSPLFASPSHHGYDATDFYTVEPRLGTNSDLKVLISSAHTRGMRVILDFVPNHWSQLHPTFLSAQRDPGSPYRDWYLWTKWPDEYRTFLDVVKELPQLNLAPGPAREYLLECARYWLEQGVDGYRLDYAYGPPHDFWADFRRACRSVRPDCWLFGEVIHTAFVQAFYAGLLDGTLDFLLARALRETFALGTWSLAEFESFLSGHEAYFLPSFSRPGFLDNHDMNRFLFMAGNDRDRLKLGALVLFTLTGPPILYYGTEVGLSQERPIHQGESGIFEEARLPMRWGEAQDVELSEYFRRLIGLRRAYPVLHYGSRRVVHLDSRAGIYAYVRESDGASSSSAGRTRERVLVALNLSDAPCRFSSPSVGLPADAADRLNRSAVTVRADSVVVELEGKSGAFVA